MTSTMNRIVAALCAAFLSACSEGRTVVDEDAAVDARPALDAAPSVDAAPPVDVAQPADAAGGAVVINEVRASSEDWVELYNPRSVPMDLSGYGLADTDTAVDGGAARVAGAVRFPAGTTLAPGQYLIVQANLSDAGAGPQMQCLMGAVMRCFHASWGISASRGETVYLLDRADRTVASVGYPGAMSVASGQTWARIPNATGDFAPARPTPGAANAAP